jgi:hypothetical protein
VVPVFRSILKPVKSLAVSVQVKVSWPVDPGAPASAKLAVMLLAWVKFTLQVPVPVQAPLQPVKLEPVAAAAVRVTVDPEVKFALQVAPQVIPAGLLVTLPVPVPLLETVRAKLGSVKLAVTLCAWAIVTVHVPVPVQAPLQPVKVEPVPAAAVRVTEALYP